MRNEKELAGAVRNAMKRQKITRDQLAQKLGINPITVDKLLCGDIEPSNISGNSAFPTGRAVSASKSP